MTKTELKALINKLECIRREALQNDDCITIDNELVSINLYSLEEGITALKDCITD